MSKWTICSQHFPCSECFSARIAIGFNNGDVDKLRSNVCEFESSLDIYRYIVPRYIDDATAELSHLINMSFLVKMSTWFFNMILVFVLGFIIVSIKIVLTCIKKQYEV